MLPTQTYISELQCCSLIIHSTQNPSIRLNQQMTSLPMLKASNLHKPVCPLWLHTHMHAWRFPPTMSRASFTTNIVTLGLLSCDKKSLPTMQNTCLGGRKMYQARFSQNEVLVFSTEPWIHQSGLFLVHLVIQCTCMGPFLLCLPNNYFCPLII